MRAGYLLLCALMLGACGRQPAAAPPALPLPALRIVLSSEATIGKLGAGTDVAHRPWVGSIVEVLGEETPEGVVPMSRQRIAIARMTPDALFDRALANLRAANLQPMHERTVQMAKARVQITRAADNHSAARLLLPELWSKIAADNGGHLWAAAPARDIVFWTTSMDESDQSALRGQARTAYQSRSFPISPAILRWTGTGWDLQDDNPVPTPP